MYNESMTKMYLQKNVSTILTSNHKLYRDQNDKNQFLRKGKKIFRLPSIANGLAIVYNSEDTMNFH